MSRNFSFSLSPTPASMIIVRAPRTMSGRMASVIRLRSSAGACRLQSTFGTTPNMAPPSRRKNPSQTEMSSKLPREKRWMCELYGCCVLGVRVLRAGCGLFELDQDAVGRRRVDEGDRRAFGARARRLVDHAHPAAL